MSTRDGDGYAVETLLFLRAARKTGALDALAERAGTPATLADETDLTPAAAKTVVRGLADLGFLEPVGEEYEFTNRALGFLAKRDLRSVGSLPGELDALDALVDLPETMSEGATDEPTDRVTDETTGGADETTDQATDDDVLRNRLGARAAENPETVRARVTAAIRAVPDAESVLAVGDGPGTHAREFSARGIDATLLDGREVVATVDPLLAPTDVVTTAESLADAEEVAPADLVFGVDLATALDPAEVAFFVGAAADRVRDGGAVVLVEPVRDRIDSESAVAIDARRLALGGGRVHAEADYREWFAAADLSLSVESIPGIEASALVGRSERAVLGD